MSFKELQHLFLGVYLYYREHWYTDNITIENSIFLVIAVVPLHQWPGAKFHHSG